MPPPRITCSYVQQEREMKSTTSSSSSSRSSSRSSDSNSEFYRTLWGSKRLDRETVVVLPGRCRQLFNQEIVQLLYGKQVEYSTGSS